MSSPKLKAYAGSDITVTFDGSRCLHFAECARGLPRYSTSPQLPDEHLVRELYR